MTEAQKNENAEAFDKIDALVAAENGQENGGNEEIVIAEAPPQKDEVEAGIEDLRKQLETEKTARADAEKRAFEAKARETRASTEAEDSNIKLIDTAIANTKREKDFLRAQFKEAMTVGDYDKVTEIQDKMTQNAVDLDKLETGKHQYVNRPKQAEAATSDPVEAFASKCSPLSAKWVREHPEFVTNAAKQREMFKAHETAVNVNGLQADSPAYFKFVEDWLDIGKQERAVERSAASQGGSPMSEAAAAPKRQTPPAAAPASRSGALGVTNQTTVTLTAEERELAEMNGMTPKEYAQHKAALIKEGRIGNSRNYN